MQVINVPDLNIVGERYESIAEFYKVNGARERNRHYRDSDYSADEEHDVNDDKRYTWEQTKHDMMFGSDLFDEEFKRCLKEVENEMPDEWKRGLRNRAKPDVVGQSVITERAIMNHPKSFSRKKPVRIKQKTISFFFSISCPWYTSVHDRLKAGCILMAICEHLERRGYQTRILYSPDFSSGKQGDAKNPQWPNMLVQFCLKDFKTRFNLKKMQFPLASKSALFQVGCWWNHRAPMQTACWGDGEGYAVDNSDERLSQAREYARRQNAVYLSVPTIRDEHGMDLMSVYGYVMKELEHVN